MLKDVDWAMTQLKEHNCGHLKQVNKYIIIYNNNYDQCICTSLYYVEALEV